MIQLLLIWRYFTSRRIAMVAITAVALLVMMVVVVLSVMSGLLEQTRLRNHRWTGDVVVSRESLVGFPDYDRLAESLLADGVASAVTPVIDSFAIEGKQSQGIRLLGIRPVEFCEVTGFEQSLYRYSKGSAYNAGKGDPIDDELFSGDSPGCIAGVYEMKRRSSRHGMAMHRTKDGWVRPEGLGVLPAVTWSVTVFPVNDKGMPVGSGIGEHQQFTCRGDSDTGLVDIDSNVLYVDFDRLQRLCYMDGSDGRGARANELRIKLAPGVSLSDGQARVQAVVDRFVEQQGQGRKARLLGDLSVQSWKQYRRSHIAPAEKERNLLVLVFLMIGLVAVFVIFAIFYMIVTEKYRDLGILKSLGCSGWRVGQVFLGYGLLVGLLGAGLGTLVGVGIVTHANQLEAVLYRHVGFQLWDPSVYAIDRIPDEVIPLHIAAIMGSAVLASVVGALFPAWRAGRLLPVAAIRAE